MFNQDTYDDDISSFNKVLSTEAADLLSRESLAVVYIGRGTCPYCRKFAKKLSGLVPKMNTTVYYVDSSNALDPDINSFREQYDIVTVPGFIVSKNGKIDVRCDSSTPEDELLAMLK